MRTVAELTLGREPDAVPRARRLVRSALAEEMPTVAADAELVVSELVTNASLHGDAPITVRVLVNGVVRIEVQDSGRAVPILLQQNPDAMTGRGLSMVAAVASEMGVQPAEPGKTVWVELDPERTEDTTPSPPVDLDALLAAWADDDPDTATYTIRLGPVSTELLLAAKTHVDNVVRELMLMREGEASSGVVLPPELAALIHTVTVEFAEARTEIKRQASAGAARGDVLTELELHLSPSAAEAGERYLAALDRADRYARAAHLLTLAPPRIHRLFRQWYVRTIIEQLRAMSAGEAPPPAVPLQVVLVEEVGRLEELATGSERMRLMQQASREPAGAVSTEEVARIAVERPAGETVATPRPDPSTTTLTGQRDILERMVAGDPLPTVLESLVKVIETVGEPGSIGSVLLVGPDGRQLRHGASRSLPRSYVEAIDGLEIGPTAGSCGTAAYTRREVVVRDIAVDPLWDDYRHLALPAGLRACWSTPILAGDGEMLGTFAVYYPEPRTPSDRERDLLAVLVRTASVAIGRSRADQLRDAALRQEQAAREELERAHEHLTFVLEATTRVASSLDSDDTLRTLARIAVPALADICLIDLLDGVGFRRAATAASEAVDAASAAGLADSVPDPAGDHPAAVALRTGRAVFVDGTDDELIRAGARSAMAIPLAARGRNLGAMTLIMVQPGRSFTEADKSMVEDLGRRVALAIDNTQLYAITREAERRLRLVARAGVLLTSSLDLDTVVGRLAELVKGEVADTCEIHVRRTPDQWWHLSPDSEAGRLLRTDRLPPLVAEAVESRSTVVTRSDAGEAFTPGASVEGEAATTVVPLIAHGDVVGVITLVSPGASEPTRVPAETLDVIAGRAALAVDNALLYEQERAAAEILQRSLLPRHLPSVGGLRSAARYLPAGARNEIGGDWYDLFHLAPERVGIVMGDVMGRGIPAASIMGQLRNGLRMLALQDVDPAEALHLLNRMLGADQDSPLATVAYGVIDLASPTLYLANAGHLPPLLIRRSESIFLDQKAGLPLGAFPGTVYTPARFDLERGDAVVLYTDGLIEQRDRSLEEGLDALLTVGRSVPPSADPDAICDALVAAFHRDRDEDDTAVLGLVLD